jgi:hypothetical protein
MKKHTITIDLSEQFQKIGFNPLTSPIGAAALEYITKRLQAELTKELITESLVAGARKRQKPATGKSSKTAISKLSIGHQKRNPSDRKKLEVCFWPEEYEIVRAIFGRALARCAKAFLLGYRVVAPSATIQNKNKFARDLALYRHTALPVRKCAASGETASKELLLKEEQLFNNLTLHLL